MKIFILISRILLAVIYLIYGLNYFVHVIPAVLPPGKAGEFEGALKSSGYFFQYMKAIQVIASLFLFFNRYVALVIVVLIPISLNIFLFHLFLAPAGMLIAVLVMLTNIFLLFSYRKNYAGVLARQRY